MKEKYTQICIAGLVVVLLLACVLPASAFTATLVSPTDTAHVYNGDNIEIRIDNLNAGDLFQINMSSPDLRTAGGECAINNFNMPFGFSTIDQPVTFLKGDNLNSTGLELDIQKDQGGPTTVIFNDTLANPYIITRSGAISARSYAKVAIIGYPLAGQAAIIDFSVRGPVADSGTNYLLNFTIRKVTSGNLTISIPAGGLNETLTLLPSTTEIGVFRQSARQFIFKTAPVTRTTWGMITDTPITGDWDGDGITDIGVFRPSAQQFIFNTAPVTRATWGMSTDIPITGDWNGDGITDIGVFRPSYGEMIFHSGPVARTYFGLSTDIPIAGNWV